MDIVAKMDEWGLTAWVIVMIAGFIIFWPIGLALLGYLIWSGRMGRKKAGRCGQWYNTDNATGRQSWGGFGGKAASSGNHAFDEYREHTLARLEEDEREFRVFLDKLRQAKDKTEFDQFMAERARATSDDGAQDDSAPDNRGAKRSGEGDPAPA